MMADEREEAVGCSEISDRAGQQKAWPVQDLTSGVEKADGRSLGYSRCNSELGGLE